MGRLVALPARGEVFADARGGDRALRVSWHHDGGDMVVLSLWHDHVCTGTVRLAAVDVPDLVGALTRGLVHTRSAVTDRGVEPAAGR